MKTHILYIWTPEFKCGKVDSFEFGVVAKELYNEDNIRIHERTREFSVDLKHYTKTFRYSLLNGIARTAHQYSEYVSRSDRLYITINNKVLATALDLGLRKWAEDNFNSFREKFGDNSSMYSSLLGEIWTRLTSGENEVSRMNYFSCKYSSEKMDPEMLRAKHVAEIRSGRISRSYPGRNYRDHEVYKAAFGTLPGTPLYYSKSK